MIVFSRNRRRLAVLLLVAAIFIMSGVGYKFFNNHRPQQRLKFTQAAPQPQATIGYIDKLTEDPANSTQIKVVGWALAKDSVSGVELVLNGQFLSLCKSLSYG